MINKVWLGGQVEKPELKRTQKGDAILNFTLKTWTTYNGKQYDSWHRCQMWGCKAEEWANIREGAWVLAEGMLKHESWTKDDGTKGYMDKVDVKALTEIGPGVAQQEAQADDDGALPF